MSLPISDTATAVGALRDLIRSVLPLPDEPAGVAVFDGPAPERRFAGRAVTVAEAFQSDQEAVMVDRVESGARPTITETVTVAGSVYVGGGDTVYATFRDQAGAILAAIEAGLRADRTLGGAVNLARMSSAQWLHGRDGKGAGVAIGYTVEMVSL